MSAAPIILPVLWASHTALPPLETPAAPLAAAPPKTVAPEIAFYRKYTEGMLRRYLRLSMERGKVSSLLGHEMFRARVTNYRVESFEDMVIFVHDVDKCLNKLQPRQKELLSRVVLQQYTLDETAELLRSRLWTVRRRYNEALDALTRIFLDVKLLEPGKVCQEAETVDYSATYTNE